MKQVPWVFVSLINLKKYSQPFFFGPGLPRNFRNTLSQYPNWDCLTLRRKCKNLWKISAMRPGRSFSIAEASRKRIRDDMKIQQTDLTNARLIKKYKSGRVTFKCQKVLWNVSLAIKESFRIERGTQNTNFRMNNSIKKQIYPKISHKHLSGPIVRYNSLSVTKTHVTSFIRHEKPADY